MRQFIYVKDPLAVSIRSNPLSKSMSIAQSLVSIIESPGLPYDIPCSGVFFSQLPRRLVSCPTLAIATSAMVKTHQSLHNHNETLYRQALSHHGTALRAVRNMLQDPSQAYSVNTACAIYLIMACQVRLGLVTMSLPPLTEIGIGASLGPGCTCYATHGHAFGNSS